MELGSSHRVDGCVFCFDTHMVGSGVRTEETRSSVIEIKSLSFRVSLFWLSPAFAGNRLKDDIVCGEHFI